MVNLFKFDAMYSKKSTKFRFSTSYDLKTAKLLRKFPFEQQRTKLVVVRLSEWQHTEPIFYSKEINLLRKGWLQAPVCEGE